MRSELRSSTEQVREPFVLVSGLPGGFGKRAQHLPPVVSDGPDLGIGPDGHHVEQLLLAHPDDFPAAVEEYEREMFERPSAAARMSADIQELLTSPDAAQKMLAFFQPG
ncbi:hypothetical protein [Streptomyces canus]